MSSLHSGQFSGSISICHTFIPCSSCMVLEIDAFRLATTQGTLEKPSHNIPLEGFRCPSQSPHAEASTLAQTSIGVCIPSLAFQPASLVSHPPSSLGSTCVILYEEGWESEQHVVKYLRSKHRNYCRSRAHAQMEHFPIRQCLNRMKY